MYISLPLLGEDLIEEFGQAHWPVHSICITVCAVPVSVEMGLGVGSF